MHSNCYSSVINLCKTTQMFQPKNNLQICGTSTHTYLFEVNNCFAPKFVPPSSDLHMNQGACSFFSCVTFHCLIFFSDIQDEVCFLLT
jgi:hypothetical protein